MIFTQVSKWAQVEKEGRYSIAAYQIPPPGTGYVFQAWRMRDKEVIYTGSAADCREACRKDWEGK